MNDINTDNPYQTVRRFARLYSDGCFNVDAGGVSEELAIKRISGCEDDDDTQLVEVEICVIRYLRQKHLSVVETSEVERLRAAFRINAMRWNPSITDAEIQEVLDACR